MTPIDAAEPVTLARVAYPGANAASEPLSKEFSLAKAVSFLDSAALHWQKRRRCIACHTDAAYLMSRPLVDSKPQAHREVRKFAEKLVNERWEKQGPRWDAEVVVAAATLAANDAQTTGQLHRVTRKALDRMWTVQRKDGGWNWLKCNWPPMESDDHYGATLAAIAVGIAPGGYARTEKARTGMKHIRRYLAGNPPPTLHHKGMVLWADSLCGKLVTDQQRKVWVGELAALQKPDGGWALATLGEWKRADGQKQDTTNSDGYGTAFVIYVLRQAGVPASDARLKRGIAWLKSNQRASGRWFTRSLYKDSKHYISHAGTAMAVMAIAACENSSRKSSRTGKPDRRN
ncbi:MAG: squalene-hopene cyclase [Planctomycetes bacterium SM23_25]|nr:MAG: squalene-hopene cyclase [Planctomycetes bacterium SM23_25]